MDEGSLNFACMLARRIRFGICFPGRPTEPDVWAECTSEAAACGGERERTSWDTGQETRRQKQNLALNQLDGLVHDHTSQETIRYSR